MQVNARPARRSCTHCKMGAGDAEMPQKTHLAARRDFAFARTYSTHIFPPLLLRSSIFCIASEMAHTHTLSLSLVANNTVQYKKWVHVEYLPDRDNG